MFRTSRMLFSIAIPMLVLPGLVCGTTGCGNSQAEPQTSKPSPEKSSPESESSNSSAKTQTEADSPEARLKSDIKEAIAVLEKGDVAAFIEQYMPLKDVQNIREFTTIEKMAEQIKTGGQFEKEWVEKLKAMEKGEVSFLDDEKSRAKFSVEVGGQAEPVAAVSLPNPAEEKNPETEGFSGDVKAAIGEAIKTLESGDHEKFVENMFPPAELSITQSDDAMKALAVRLKEHPEMAEQMLSDLKALQKLEPKMNAEETQATFELVTSEPKKDMQKEITRTIIFEKADTWRFANTAKKIRTQMHQQSQQPPIAVKKTLETEWIRIRDHWRMNKTD